MLKEKDIKSINEKKKKNTCERVHKKSSTLRKTGVWRNYMKNTETMDDLWEDIEEYML